MNKPSRLAQDLLLLAKGHYGTVNDRTMLDYVLIIIRKHMLLDLIAARDANGTLVSATTRTTVAIHVIDAVSDYYGESKTYRHLKEPTLVHFIHGRFDEGISHLMSLLAILAISADDHPAFRLPDFDPELQVQIYKRRQELAA